MATIVDTALALPVRYIEPAVSQGPFNVLTIEELAAHQFSHLASQHQLSEYNRLKFGPHGRPAYYVPLSLQAPDSYRHLQFRQTQCAKDQAWFITSSPDLQELLVQPPALLLGPQGNPDADGALASQLTAAMEDALALDSIVVSQREEAELAIKTSSSHPINVSAIIPVESIELISSHVLLSSSESTHPNILDISPSFTLDKVVFTTPLPTAATTPRTAPLPAQPVSPPRSFYDLLLSRSNVRSELEAAMNSGISIRPEIEGQTSEGLPAALANTSPAPFTIGNILLSSCPGKKVRLEGPVRGRPGIHRDLVTDLIRIKDLGVGCVICCLDDSELELLGASWPEYERVAREVKLDVLRLPTPEGLAPGPSPAAMNFHVEKVIKEYTLRGVSVLVHCRGGIGRAAVVASCILIRLGLCGWLDTSMRQYVCLPGSKVAGPARLDALHLVEKVIAVMRRRRSIKAIETYEQVRFLLEYVEFLRSKP